MCWPIAQLSAWLGFSTSADTHVFLSFPFPGPFSSCPTTFHHHSPPCTNPPFTGRAACDALLCSHSLCPALFCKLSHQNKKIKINRTIEQDIPSLTGKEQNNPERKVGDGLVLSQPAFPQSHVLPPAAAAQPIRHTQPFSHLFRHQSLIICAISVRLTVGLNDLKGLFQPK